MKNYDTIFLDRDGTLNPDPGYINSLDQFRLYEFTIPALKMLAEKGHRFCIMTNQSGICRGMIKREKLEEIHAWLKKVFFQNELPLLGIYWNADHPDRATNMRKPGPGMFLEAAKDHYIDLGHSLIIGDSMVDMKAGKNLGMDTMLVLTGNGKKLQKSGEYNPTYIAEDLLAGAKTLTEVSQ